MSTVGHFTTMIGVFCFYTTLLESSFEKKLTTYSYNLVPRFYNNSSFVCYKNINQILNINNKLILNNKKTRIFITKGII
jgi:hypothetical protein